MTPIPNNEIILIKPHPSIQALCPGVRNFRIRRFSCGQSLFHYWMLILLTFNGVSAHAADHVDRTILTPPHEAAKSCQVDQIVRVNADKNCAQLTTRALETETA